MATFEAEMEAFRQKGEDLKIRKIDVPDKDLTGNSNVDLETIFYWGQNDVQSRECPSLSVGDVIHYKEKRFVVTGVGFQELKPDEKGGLNKGYGFLLVKDS